MVNKPFSDLFRGAPRIIVRHESSYITLHNTPHNLRGFIHPMKNHLIPSTHTEDTENTEESKVHQYRLMRILFMLLGGTFLILGIIGIALPVLPTTPFILLAAACWARGSQRFHDWLIQHRVFGNIVKNWQKNRAIPRGAKYLAWSMMTLSCAMLFYRMSEDLQWLAWLTSCICFITALWMARLPNA